MAHISFLSNFFGRKAHTSAILFGRHFMYGDVWDVWLFLFITADRTLEASRLQNYLKTETKHGGVVARAGTGTGELDQYLGMTEPGRV